METLRILVLLVAIAAVKTHNDHYVEDSTTRVKQYFHQDCEIAINKQINIELKASYEYQSMAWYFNKDTVALPGFHKFFEQQSQEERSHATKLMEYMNKRGGSLLYSDIQKPTTSSWGSPLDAVSTALETEKNVNDELMKVHRAAEESGDPHMMDFIESNFLDEQVKSIKFLSDLITKLKRAGPGLGEYIIDKELRD